MMFQKTFVAIALSSMLAKKRENFAHTSFNE